MQRRGWCMVLATAVCVVASGCTTTDAGGDRKVALPAAFPADLPRPEAAEVRTALDLGDKGLNVMFETGIAPPAAAVGYRERLERAGWRLVAEVSTEEGDFMSFRRGGRSVAVSVGRTVRGTGVGVAYVALP